MRANIIAKNIDEAFIERFSRYTKTVVEDRALPDVRDGLKPVQRRVLYGMDTLDLYNKKVKSAKVVGEVMGNFHPHGDSSIYEALVRMCQEFSLRYPLVSFQGGRGSIDGDSASAMRYTSSGISAFGKLLLGEIDPKKKVVDFVLNYDEECFEPTILAGVLPNLLVNGSNGVAVGISCTMPTHHLGEVINVIQYVLKHPACSIKEISGMITPDLPTGGRISGDFPALYENGKGSFNIYSRMEFEEKKGKEYIVISEIPYLVKKMDIVETIDAIVREVKEIKRKQQKELLLQLPTGMASILDIKDESDENILIRIEIEKGTQNEVMAFLDTPRKAKWTAIKYHVQYNVIDRDKPKWSVTLKSLVEYYIEHQKDVGKRLAQYQLDQALQRKHILEGYMIAFQHLDRMVTIIRQAQDQGEAKEKLKTEFQLSDAQSQHILDMRLVRLTKLRVEKVQAELEEKEKEIKDLQAYLSNEALVIQKIYAQLESLRLIAGKRRSTVE